jgi:hypothetical protein
MRASGLRDVVVSRFRIPQARPASTGAPPKSRSMPRQPPELVIRHNDAERRRRLVAMLALVWLGSILLTVAFCTQVLSHRDDAPNERIKTLEAEADAARSRIVVLERAEQVARTAIGQLQGDLSEREEEIAALRSDLAFYNRLAGGEKREGLSVSGVTLTAVPGSRAWNFLATVTQSFRRGEITRGHLTVSVEGIVDGRLRQLDWGALSQHQNESGIAYSFKYFQRVSGTIMLPGGFTPNRIRVRLDGSGGRVEQAFAWDAAVAEEDKNVQS